MGLHYVVLQQQNCKYAVCNLKNYNSQAMMAFILIKLVKFFSILILKFAPIKCSNKKRLFCNMVRKKTQLLLTGFVCFRESKKSLNTLCYHLKKLNFFQRQQSRGALQKYVLLKISQNSQENSWARVSFSIKLQA